jgi:hypothetical protein
MTREYKCEYEYVVGGEPQKAEMSVMIHDAATLASIIKYLCEGEEDKQMISLKLTKVRDIND